MTKCRYLIEGKLYEEGIDLPAIITKLANDHNLTPKIEPTENGFSVEIEADIMDLLNFEPILFKKIANFMEIKLYTKKNQKPKKKSDSKTEKKNKKPFKLSAQYLRQEKIIAIKGNNGFHLVCNASKAQAVQALRELIKEPEKSLFIMYKSLIKAEQLILLSKKEEELLQQPQKPIVISKLRQLHRLEKVRIKHRLTPMINPINHRIGLTLIHNKLYKKLFDYIEFPIVTMDALDENGVIISDIEKLSHIYGEGIEYILDSDKDIENPKLRDILQVTYGKTQTILTDQKPDDSCEIFLGYKESKILDLKLKPLKIFENKNPRYSALALLFANLAIEKVLELKLSFDHSEIKELYKEWENSKITSTSLLTLFDAIASLSDELHDKSFIEQSIMLTEMHYEVCEEDIFEFSIKENEISIDIISAYLKNSKLKHLGSTLVNTISTIIANRAKESAKSEVRLCGELFNYRDLSELTIEKLEDEDIKAILS
jgi:hydrogenase maturation factor HypF (carbamoyltransferase family)